ncbi:MAG: response regulator transcription factor [Cyanobacteriota bacterium]
MSPIKVLIVEDHSLTRVGLKFTLEKHEDLIVIGEAEDGAEAIEKTKELSPDVILMDLGMPNMNGIEATTEIKKSYPDSRVIILTSHDEEEEVLAAFTAGADAYCMKDIPPERLVQAIQSVNDGVVWLDPSIAEIVLSFVPRPEAKKNKITLEDLHLTPREVEVLKLIVDGHSNADIAYDLTVSMHTVKTHISNILSKLGVNDRTQAAVKAMRENLV